MKALLHDSVISLTAREPGRRIGANAPLAASEDAREGPRAFAEKRPALWRER